MSDAGAEPGDAADVVLGRLRALADLRRWADLERTAAEALADRPLDPTISAHLARALLLQDRPGDAVDIAGDALAAHPDDAWLARVLTSALVAAGRADDAAGVLDRLLAADPDGYHVRVLAARVALRRYQVDDAADHARAAIAADPSRAGGHVMLAASLSQAGRPLDAEEVARAGLEVDPRSGDLHGQLAVALERTGRRAEAAAHWVEAGRVGRHPQAAVDGLQALLAEPPAHRLWLAVAAVASVIALGTAGALVESGPLAIVAGLVVAAVVTVVFTPALVRWRHARRRRQMLDHLPPDVRAVVDLAAPSRDGPRSPG